jgi:hypothetical protein
VPPQQCELSKLSEGDQVEVNPKRAFCHPSRNQKLCDRVADVYGSVGLYRSNSRKWAVKDFTSPEGSVTAIDALAT